MRSTQEPDEIRVRQILRQAGVGPDAIPPQPTARPRDWLDDILDEPAPAPPAPAAPQDTVPPAPSPATVKKPKKPKKGRGKKQAKAQAAPIGWERSPRQSLADAYDRIPPRVKWLAYHATAAYLGWSVGLVDWTTRVTAWIDTTGLIGPQAIFWYCTAGGTFLLHHRTRHWWRPVAWLAAVPASSVITGVLLYAPTT